MMSVQPAKAQISIRAFASMAFKLLIKHHLAFLRLTGGCTGSSESTLVKIPHCWKSHFTAHFLNFWKLHKAPLSGRLLTVLFWILEETF